MTRGLIFDFDGTIVDTESPAHQSMVHVWAAHGQELDFEWWIAGLGTDRKHEWVGELERRLGRRLEHERVIDDRRRLKDEITDRQPILPGVRELIDGAVARGIPLAVGSSSPHEWVDRHLERVGLLDHFDHVVCRDDVAGVAKPAPDVFLRAIELLGASPDHTVVVEDSHNGVTAARSAGLRSIVVPNPLVRHLEFPEATLRLDALDHRHPDDLLDELFAALD